MSPSVPLGPGGTREHRPEQRPPAPGTAEPQADADHDATRGASDASGGTHRRAAAVGDWFQRLWHGAERVELLHRSMGFAALGLVTLVPLLIVVAAADPFHRHGLAGWVVDGMDLPSKDAASVQRLFATQHQVLSTTSALSLAAVAVFGLTFVSAVQNGYERVWQLPAGPWRHAWRRTIRRAVWLAVLTAYLYAVAQSRDLLDGGTAQTAVRVVLILAAGLVFFWWGQSFLLGRRVPALRLLPGALLTVGGLAGLRWFSGLVFSRMIVDNAVSYGVVGTVLVVESWLIGVGFVVFGGALLGRRLVCPEAAEAPDRPGNTES